LEAVRINKHHCANVNQTNSNISHEKKMPVTRNDGASRADFTPDHERSP
jgi:hypothetical protein